MVLSSKSPRECQNTFTDVDIETLICDLITHSLEGQSAPITSVKGVAQVKKTLKL